MIGLLVCIGVAIIISTSIMVWNNPIKYYAIGVNFIILAILYYMLGANQSYESVVNIDGIIPITIENKFDYCLYKKWNEKEWDVFEFNVVYTILPISECKSKFNEIGKSNGYYSKTN